MNLFTRITVFLFLSGIFLSGSISMIEDWAYLTNIILATSCFGVLTIYLLNYKVTMKIHRTLTIIFLLFIFFMTFSTLIHANSQMLLSTVRYLLVFITLCIIIPNLLKKKTFLITIASFLFSQFPLLLFSFIVFNPFSNFSGAYIGIFYNPNSFGGFTATIFVILLALFYSYIGTSKYKTQFLLLLSLFVLFLLTSFSGSRTSLVAICLIIFMIIIFHILKNTAINNISLKRVGNLFIGFIVFSISTVWFRGSRYYEVFNERIIEKFIRKIDSGDILDRRGDILSATLNDSSLFGYGPEYFIQSFGLGAHNSFLSLLGQYGLLATIVFVLFWIYTILKGIRYYFSSSNRFSILPIIIVMFFVVTSMTEIMLMKVSMLFAFVAIGVITQQTQHKNIEDTEIY